MRKKWKQWQTIFLGSKITADGDYSHENKRCLFLERKAMTNLDSILKSGDVTLPSKVHIVKAMVFPAVMYGCESWGIKKAECQRTDAFKLWCWRRLLTWTARVSNQSIIKEINSEYSLEGLMLKLKLQYFSHLMRRLVGKDPDAGKNWGDKEKGVTEEEMVGWHRWLNEHDFKQALGPGDGQRSLATEQLNWSELESNSLSFQCRDSLIFYYKDQL